MDVIRVTATGGPEVLELAQTETPTPGPGQVLVKVAAAGINYIETYQRSGAYPMPLPFTPGGEGAGTVVAVGPDVTSVEVGDRVASTNLAGSYAQYALAEADRVIPVPDKVDDDAAAAALLQGMTAHYLLHDSYPVRAGDTVLVHAAAGGMGLLLTQWASSLGVKVIGTVSTAEKEKLARQAGAAEVLGYDAVPDQVRELTGGAGVAAVYDGVGQATFEGSLASLRTRGTLVLFGQASGPVPPFPPARLAAGSFTLTRPTLTHFVVTREELVGRAGAVLSKVSDGSLRMTIGARYPLADAARAHEDLQSRRTTGKLLLIP